jgi:hypothetical protein
MVNDNDDDDDDDDLGSAECAGRERDGAEGALCMYIIRQANKGRCLIKTRKAERGWYRGEEKR